MSRRGGWIFVDVLAALGIIAAALGCLAPSLAELGKLQARQEARVFASIRAGLDDPWASLR
jgi:hypothetical protein